MAQLMYVEIDPTVPPGEQRTEIEKKIDERILARVKYGMELLEQKFGPSWVDHIDLKTLELADGQSCVLGQVYATKCSEDENGYELGLMDLDIGYDDGAAAGFSLDDDDRFRESEENVNAWDRLQDAWTHVLTPFVSKN